MNLRMATDIEERQLEFKISSISEKWVLCSLIESTEHKLWEIIKSFNTKADTIEHMNITYGTTVLFFDNDSDGDIYITAKPFKRKRFMKRLCGHMAKTWKRI